MTEKKDTRPLAEILKCYVMHENGAIFNVLKDERDPLKCYLRTKNSYTRMSVREIKQGLVDGKWKAINEHQWRKWVKEDNEYIENLTNKLVKRIILSQVLIEINDDLIIDHEDDKHMRNVLEKSNKQLERLVEKNYDRLYHVDKQILQNLANETEKFIDRASKLKIEEFIYVNKMLDDYLAEPEAFQPKTVELTKVE